MHLLCKFRRPRALAALLLLALVCSAAAQGDDPKKPAGPQASGDSVVIFTVPHVEQKVDELTTQLAASQKKTDAAEQTFQGAAPEGKPRLEQIVQAARNETDVLQAAVTASRDLLHAATQPGHQATQQALLSQALGQVYAAQAVLRTVKIRSALLDDLRERAAIAQQATSSPTGDAASATLRRATGESTGRAPAVFSTGSDFFREHEMGGGVFLDEPAQLPVDPRSVLSAEYDLGQQRFVLRRAEGADLWLPRMDPNLAAVMVRCLYRAPPANQITMSLGIDPLGRGEMKQSMTGYQNVLFGCEALWDTDAGRILIDSDWLLSAIWEGRNRDGAELTRQVGYTSPRQMLLDYPMPLAPGAAVPAEWRLIGMRFWVRGDVVKARLQGRELSFAPVPLRLYTATVRRLSANSFAGSSYPNPGADSFAGFFNQNYRRFVPLVLRTEVGGAEIRPFVELRKLAEIAGTVLWLRDHQVAMDPAWADRYPVAYVPTRVAVPIETVSRASAEKALLRPAVIFNQYGPSRVLDSDGSVYECRYDEAGRFVQMLRVAREAQER